jgi:hypothetical protein
LTSNLTTFKVELEWLSTADTEDLLRASRLYFEPKVEAAGSYESVSAHSLEKWLEARSVADIEPALLAPRIETSRAANLALEDCGCSGAPNEFRQ